MIIAFHFPGLRQLPHDMVEPAMRLMAIGLGGFHHGIDHCTGIGAGGCIAKEPGAASSDKGTDRALAGVVVDRQIASLNVTNEPGPVLEGIGYGHPKGPLGWCAIDLSIKPELDPIKDGFAALFRFEWELA